ncbi:MAG: hypothetical protein AAF748_06930 [Pseudomonadota bacterium]
METLTRPFLHQSDIQERKSLVIHCAAGWLKSVQEGKHDFFRKLIRHVTLNGMTSRLVAAEGHAARLMMEQNHLHLMVGCPPGYGPGRLHAHPSHIWGFWYFDEIGADLHSSLRFARFHPDEIDREKAEYFFNGVASYMTRENVSKRAQPARLEQPLAAAAAVIFCQQIELGQERTHYLTTEQMVRVTATTHSNETVYLKPHPDQPKLVRKALFDLAAQYPNIRVLDASVHDLVQASQVVVTQNSSAGFEALLQQKPVITCGKSDYWHATLTPRNETDLKDALVYGPDAMSDFQYAKFLYWFLDRNCLEPAKKDFGQRAWSRIRDKLCI